MKALKIILLSILSIFVAVYFAFLFILPYVIDLNQYSPQITKEIEKNTGFKVKTQGLKVKTAWNLSAGAQIDKTDLSYPTGEKFAQLNKLQVKLSLLPIFMGQLRVDNISADKIFVNMKVDKNGKFELEKYLPKQDKNAPAPAPMPLKLSNSMPDIKVNTYRISFIDAQTSKIYSIKGEDFKVWDFVLNKKIKAKNRGVIILDNRKQISYKVALNSKVFAPQAKQTNQPQNINIINIFKDLYKYNLCTDINADIKLTGDSQDPKVDGYLNLDNIAFTLESKTLPKSNLNLKFKGDKVKINSNFYTDVNEKALITGVFNNGKKKSIDLKVVSDKTDIGNVFLISNSLLKLAGIKDLEGIKANGHLNANFDVKSNFKTIQSSGYLKIDNANITHELYKVALKSICADIDFSSNKIDIKKSSALINGEPITVNGSINKNANADINVFAKNLQLKGLLATLGQIQTLKENDIYSGAIDLKASLKGRLDKAIPTVDIIVRNVNLKNKPNKTAVKFSSAKIKAASNGKKTNGKIELLMLKVASQGTVFSVPVAGLSFNEKDLNIDKAILFLNSSKIDVFGKVTDYATKKINFDMTARGLIRSTDIKSMLPKSNQQGVSAVGKIPLLVRITGVSKQNIRAQMLANNTNHLAVFDISSLRGKTSLINAELQLDGNKLNIDEIALYTFNSSKGLSQNMSANLASGIKIATINGKFTEINSKSPYIQNLNVNVPTQISTTIPGFKNSNVTLKANVNVSGTSSNPEINGVISLPTITLPTLKMNISNLNVDLGKNSITANCPKMNISNSIMGFNAILDNDFSHGAIIRNLDFNADNIDLDTLGAALSNLPQNTNGPGTDLGVIVLGGNGSAKRVKTGGIIATNVTSKILLKNNILKLTDVNADAFFGKVAGLVTYNLIYGNIGLDLQGRNLSAGPAIKGLTGMPDSLNGQLDFDSNISMVGYTQEQLIRSLKGTTGFIISNGKMGKLGKLEHLLYAQNILSNNFFKTTLNVIAKAVSIKNTGSFKYIKGEMTFSQGWANLSYIKTSGPAMSMYVTGRFNMLNNSANLTVLGRLSDDVVRILGPLGELSMDKMLSYIPKVGAITSALINQMTTNPDYENTSLIPPLTPQTSMPTKNFKVIINGGVDSQSSVKSFKWLSTPTATQTPQTGTNIPPQVNQAVQNVQKRVQQGASQILQQVAPVTKGLPSPYSATPSGFIPPKVPAPVADFINGLPDLR